MTVFLQSLVLGLLLGGVYALAASGLTLIFGVMKVINIAHGAFLVLASFITYTLWDVAGHRPAAGHRDHHPVIFAIGWVTYKVVVSPIRSAPMASTVLLTFGLALVLEGAMGEIWGNNSTAIRPSYADESFTIGGIFLPKAQVYGGLIAVAVLVVLWPVLTRTWLGRAIRAAATNPSSAPAGRDPGPPRWRPWCSRSASPPRVPAARSPACSTRSCRARTTSGSPGCSRSSCSAAWAASTVRCSAPSCSGSPRRFTSTYVSPSWATAVPYAIVFAVLLIRPQGLLGTRLREDAVAA